MGVKEVLQRLGEKASQRKEILRSMEEQERFSKIVQERQMSANERELNRYREEDREEEIKEALEYARKKRDYDIRFNHNPLDAKNITNHTDWEVLKEKNQFKNNGCMFSNQPSVLKNNNKLLRTNKKLLKGGNMFRI